MRSPTDESRKSGQWQLVHSVSSGRVAALLSSFLCLRPGSRQGGKDSNFKISCYLPTPTFPPEPVLVGSQCAALWRLQTFESASFPNGLHGLHLHEKLPLAELKHASYLPKAKADKVFAFASRLGVLALVWVFFSWMLYLYRLV